MAAAEENNPSMSSSSLSTSPSLSTPLSLSTSPSTSALTPGKLNFSQDEVGGNERSELHERGELPPYEQGGPEGNGESPRPSEGENEGNNNGNNNGNTNGNASNETRSPIEKTLTSSIRDNIIIHSVKDNKNITVLIFTAFSMVGIASTVLFGGSNVAYDAKHGRYGPASLTIWGYGIAIASLTCAWLIKMTTQDDRDASGSVGIVNIVTILVIAWIIYLNLSNYKKINMKKLPKNYFVVSTWSLYLTLMQYAYFIFTLYPLSDTLTQDGTMVALTFIISIIIAFNFALIVIQQIILDNFSVDVL